ncbi:MAG: ATP-dependent zinc metalloprotease FtsH [Bacteroidales bacterium]|nr:ATP-dependent zinc metalloprotease FtsH [Bacteroidales bacterium]
MVDSNQNQNRQNNQGSDSNNNEKKPFPKFNIYWVYALIAIFFIALNFMNLGGSAKEITWQEFQRNMLKNNDVEKIVVINKQKAEIYLKQEALNQQRYDELFEDGMFSVPKEGPHFFFTIGSIEMFEQRLSDAQDNMPEGEYIEVRYETRKDVLGEVLTWLLPIFILVAIWLFIFRRIARGSGGGGGGNIFNVGKSKAVLFDKESNVKIDFSDVAGLDEAKVEVREVVEFLKNPKKYTELGGKIPKGVLLVGPPGTGKTLMAKAVAGEASVPFFSISGSDFVEMFVGVGASRVRDLFKQAKEKAPCIIFIDEIDAIGRARGKNPSMGANDERENTLNQLLAEMDGFSNNIGIIIVAATNRADMLDKALLRAGRFDRQIHVDLPDLNERKQIFRVHVKPLKVAKDLDIDFLAKQTPGFSGADIANVSNEAALIAARKDKKAVEKEDFLDAIDRIIAGLERKNKLITSSEKKAIAYHECGHAIVSWMLKHASPLVKVTIVPRGKALGSAWYLPEERNLTTTDQMLDEMSAALGGRAAEQLVFDKISTGALNDLEKITKQAYAMVAYFGMSDKIGNLSFYDSTGQREFTFTKPYSEKTAELIDKEVQEYVDKAYSRAYKILSEHREQLNQLAELLLEKEIIFTEDLERILGKREIDDEKKQKILEEGKKVKKIHEDSEKQSEPKEEKQSEEASRKQEGKEPEQKQPAGEKEDKKGTKEKHGKQPRENKKGQEEKNQEEKDQVDRKDQVNRKDQKKHSGENDPGEKT